MEEEISQADFADWKKHPFTIKLMEFLKDARDQYTDGMFDIGMLKGSIETNEKLAWTIGLKTGLDMVIDIQYDEVGVDDEQ